MLAVNGLTVQGRSHVHETMSFPLDELSESKFFPWVSTSISTCVFAGVSKLPITVMHLGQKTPDRA